MQLCIFEDTQYTNFQPLVYFRPVYDLRCGVLTLRQKIESLLQHATVVFHVRKELEGYYGEENPSYAVNHLAEDDTWLINGRVIADELFTRLIRMHDRSREIVFRQDAGVVAAFIKSHNISRIAAQLSTPLSEEVFRNIPTGDSSVRMVHYPWDIIHNTAMEIENDFRMLKKIGSRRRSNVKVYPGSHLLQKDKIILGSGTVVKPGVVLDAEQGPIIIGDGVMMMPNAVIEGPAYIGDGTLIKAGAKIYHGTSIGKRCKVGGEVEASIVQGFSNKQHEGFLGHSYLGSWVNIGADTNTSDLKNTYGTVKVQLDAGQIDTGMQFVGIMMGDHSKTGINVMFDTGTIVGVSGNIYGAGLPPKFVPSFSWGEGKSFMTYNLEKSLETSRRVFSRRDIIMTDTYEKLFRHVFAITAESRKKAGIA
ncbi:MAG: GlmU family protein [Ignavibacteriae bacterium]|nr:GlmU family protein [Ignavibacteria bacterium]MBI3365242.1 GlmU family protein [Ignavibacteriota bacterium]